MLRALLILGMLVLQSSLVGAATYYAQPGSGNTSCSAATNQNTPYGGAALAATNCLGAGDTLVLTNGTYNECLNDVIPQGIDANNPTTVKALNKWQAVLGWTTLDSTSWGNCTSVVIKVGIRAGFNDNTTGTPRHYITIDGLKLLIPGNQFGQGINFVGGHEWPVGHTIDFDGPHDIQILNNDISGGKGQGADTSSFSIGTGHGYNTQNWTFRGNYVHDLGADWTSGTTYTYGFYNSGRNTLFENNEVARVPGYAIHGYSDHDVFNGNTYRNNYIHDTQGSVLFACGGSNNLFYNNILARTGLANDQHAGGLMLGPSCSGAQPNSNGIYNNTIVWATGDACIRLGGDAGGLLANNNTVRNNICYNSTGGATDGVKDNSGGTGNAIGNNLCSAGPGCVTSGDPLFQASIPNSDLVQANITAASFKLQDSSPAIGQGADVSAIFTTDIGGQTRPAPAGTSPDLGAWEAGGASIPPLPGQLYLYWRLDESSGTVAADSSTTTPAHPGALTGTPLPAHVAGRIGAQAVSVSGAGEHVETSTTFTWPSAQAVTLVFWVKVASGGSMALGTASSTPNLFGVCAPCPPEGAQQQSFVYWQYGTWNDPGGAGSMFTEVTSLVGSWMHVAVGANGSNEGKIWINGQLKAGPTTFSVPTAAETTPFEAGRWNKPNHVANGNGLIDDVRIYSQYLTDADVLLLYRTSAGRVRHGAIAYR